MNGFMTVNHTHMHADMQTYLIKNMSQNFQKNPIESNFHRGKFCYQLKIYVSHQN